ncbi:hypothetical protein CR513_35210, partial [Mucuna pruriens]
MVRLSASTIEVGQFIFLSQGLWNVVIFVAEPLPSRENPTTTHIKIYDEEKLKKDKTITCSYLGLTNRIFTKIMKLKTPKHV